MGFWDKLLGREQPQPQGQQPYGNQQGGYQQNQYGQQQYGQQYGQQPQPGQPLTDEQAIARYRYMLQTAPPETIEQAHIEAFSQLTPEQRQQVLAGLSSVTPEAERSNSDDPRNLARMATRAEMRQPGTLERTFSGMGGGMSMGGMMAGSFLSSIAGVFIGTMIAQSFFGGFGGYGSGYNEGYQDGQQADEQSAQDTQDTGGDYSDAGTGDYGSDFGGGDFGGGDFGGGDFGGFGDF